jgi:N-acetylglutamate synthase-like GNAT family acetyltransferase
MSQSGYHVRRATVDDLESLRALWGVMRFSPVELEPQLTEFQVVEAEDGAVLGAFAIKISGRHGQLHSESFRDFAMADELRRLLWTRVQSVAANHGLARLWTRETAPFWKQNGFNPAGNEALKKLPADWADRAQADWLTLQLRDEAALEHSLDVEFARFQEEVREQTQRSLQSGKTLKYLSTVLAIIFAACVMIGLIFLLKNSHQLPGR